MGNDVLRAGIMGLILLLVVGFLALPLPSSLQIGVFNHIHFALLYILAVVGVVIFIEQIISWVTGKPSSRSWVLILSAAIFAIGLVHILTARMSIIHIAGSYDRLLNDSPWAVLKEYISEVPFLEKLPAIAISGLVHTILGAAVLLLEILRGLVGKRHEMPFLESILFTVFVVGASSLLMFARNLSVRSAWRRNFDLVAPAIIQQGDIPTGVTARVLGVIQWTITLPLIILAVSFGISLIVYVLHRLLQAQKTKAA